MLQLTPNKPKNFIYKYRQKFILEVHFILFSNKEPFFPKHLNAGVRNYYILKCEAVQPHATLPGQGKVSKIRPLAEAQAKEQETATFPSSGNYLPLRRSKGSPPNRINGPCNVYAQQAARLGSGMGKEEPSRSLLGTQGGRGDLVFFPGPSVLDVKGALETLTRSGAQGQH